MKTLLFQLVLLAVYPLLGGHTLFDGGKSRYCIVVARDASASERTAAGELSDCVFQMSGARLPVVEEGRNRGPAIHVGYTARTAAIRASCSGLSTRWPAKGGGQNVVLQ